MAGTSEDDLRNIRRKRRHGTECKMGQLTEVEETSFNPHPAFQGRISEGNAGKQAMQRIYTYIHTW